MGSKKISPQIIVSLDGITSKKAVEVAKKLKGLVWGFKVNDLLFEDDGIIRKLKRYGWVFADAKLHDIPNTVANSVEKLSRAGADMITVHASGGVEMMQSAVRQAKKRTKIIAVTVLTSHKKSDNFKKLFKDIKLAGADGIVSSAHELKLFNKEKYLKIVPGIRPAWYGVKDDQKRTAGSKEAAVLGADYLFIGRPILNSKNIVLAVRKITKEIE